MFWPAIIFIAACIVFAVYNFLAFRGRTLGTLWHLLQFASASLFIAAGFLLGCIPLDWHTFGEIAAVAILGIPAYIATLRYLQRT